MAANKGRTPSPVIVKPQQLQPDRLPVRLSPICVRFAFVLSIISPFHLVPCRDRLSTQCQAGVRIAPFTTKAVPVLLCRMAGNRCKLGVRE